MRPLTSKNAQLKLDTRVKKCNNPSNTYSEVSENLMAIIDRSWGDIISEHGVDIISKMRSYIDFTVDSNGEVPNESHFISMDQKWRKGGLTLEKEQLERVKGGACRLEETGFLGIAGQAGVGKTLISAAIIDSIAVNAKKSHFRMVAVTPGTVIKSFLKNYRKVFPDAFVIDLDGYGLVCLRALEMSFQGRGCGIIIDRISDVSDILSRIGVETKGNFLTTNGEKNPIRKNTRYEIAINGAPSRFYIHGKVMLITSKQEEYIKNVLGHSARIIAKKPTRKEIWIVGRDSGKFSRKPIPAFQKKIGGYCCPSCGGTPHVPKKEKQGNVTVSVMVPAGLKDLSSYIKCNTCNEPLYGFAARHVKKEILLNYKKRVFNGGGRVSQGEYIRRINRFGKVFDFGVFDEIHEYKAQDSLQGKMVGEISGACEYKLAMSGTWTGGYASDLYYLFWRLVPYMMTKYPFHRPLLWNLKYGVMKTETVFDADTMRRNTKKTNSVGINPLIFTDFFLQNFIFLKIDDMERGRKLKYTEKLVPSNMTDIEKASYASEYAHSKEEVIRAVDSVIRNEKVEFNRRKIIPEDDYWKKREKHVTFVFASKIIYALFSIVDKRERQVVEFTDNTDAVHTVTISFNSDNLLSEKEVNLLRIGKKAPNCVLVYIESSGDRTLGKRLESLGNANGIKTKLLPKGIKVKDRQEWMENAKREGIKMVISNTRMLSTGVNLYDYTDIVFFQPVSNIYISRQAARRSLRIMQTEAVRVHFLYTCDTIQEKVMIRASTAIDAARQAEGDIAKYGVEELSMIKDTIFRELVENFIKEAKEIKE